jgi:hypothetical protein
MQQAGRHDVLGDLACQPLDSTSGSNLVMPSLIVASWADRAGLSVASHLITIPPSFIPFMFHRVESRMTGRCPSEPLPACSPEPRSNQGILGWLHSRPPAQCNPLGPSPQKTGSELEERGFRGLAHGVSTRRNTAPNG